MQSEWLVDNQGEIVVPGMVTERLKNEVAAINFIKNHTNIPVPDIHCAFEDNGRYYIIMEMTPGIIMARLTEDQKAVVIKEVEHYLEIMRGIKSRVMGSFSGTTCLPYRVANVLPRDAAMKFRGETTEEFVLCHNDLSQYNIIVDEETLKINAILDWEYAGFYPKKFDGAFYKRRGPSVALAGEDDDIHDLLDTLEHYRQK
jgi:aminoglycoside phosphotransferase